MQTVKVRGAKRSLSKMAGHLEPPALVEVFVASGRKINYLAGANLIKRFNLNSLEKYRQQFWLVKVIMELFKENSGDLTMWLLLNEYYQQLDVIRTDKEAELLKNIFIWRLGAVLGLKPDLINCHDCGRQASGFYLNMNKGSLVCENCHSGGGYLLSGRILESLGHIYAVGLGSIFNELVGSDELFAFHNFTIKYWQHRLETKL